MPDYTLKRPVINGRQSDTWYVCWSEARRTYRVSTRTTDLNAAKRFKADWEAAKAAPPETVTIEDLAVAYLEDRDGADVSYPAAIRNSLRHIRRELGHLTPSLISQVTVNAYKATRNAQGVIDATVDKELRFLRQALKLGKRQKWIDEEPTFRAPGGSAPRQRFLTRAEFARIYFYSSPPHLRLFETVALTTLARGKHILALTWPRVDFDNDIIWYAPHKPGSNKRRRPVSMGEVLRPKLLKAREAAQSDHVIEWRAEPVKSVRKAWERAVRLSGVQNATKHDLRRTGASWAIQDGLSFDSVAALLGDTVEMTKDTYAVFSPSYLRDVVRSIEGGRGGR